MSRWWSPISFALHILWAIIVFALIAKSPIISAELIASVSATPDVDAIGIASQLGRLDLVTLVFSLSSIILALLGFMGFGAIRREAISEAKTAAESVIPGELKKYMDINGSGLIRDCLKDAEIASGLQAEIIRLGIRESYQAQEVDTDAEKRETE